MKQFKKTQWIVFFCTLLFLGSCQTSQKKSHEGDHSSTWPGEMQTISSKVMDIAPYLYNREAFEDPENQKEIVKKIKGMAEVTHKISKLKHNEILNDLDPGIKTAANNLNYDVNLALESFSRGYKNYARTLLKSAMKYCFHCHTRNNIGPQLSRSSLNEAPLELKDMDAVEFLVASRQYDRALKILEGFIMDPSNIENRTFKVEDAIQRHISISLKVKKDMNLSLSLIRRFIKKFNTPQFLIDQFQSYQKDLLAWQKLKLKRENTPFAQAKIFFKKAQKQKEFSLDGKGFVYLVLAARSLHDFLQSSQKKPPAQVAEAMLMLGDSYQTLRDPSLWFLHETYYESCIHLVPYTALAKKCYRRYEASVYMGYTGSAGVFIPARMQKKLGQLRKMSFPK